MPTSSSNFQAVTPPNQMNSKFGVSNGTSASSQLDYLIEPFQQKEIRQVHYQDQQHCLSDFFFVDGKANNENKLTNGSNLKLFTQANNTEDLLMGDP